MDGSNHVEPWRYEYDSDKLPDAVLMYAETEFSTQEGFESWVTENVQWSDEAQTIIDWDTMEKMLMTLNEIREEGEESEEF